MIKFKFPKTRSLNAPRCNPKMMINEQSTNQLKLGVTWGVSRFTPNCKIPPKSFKEIPTSESWESLMKSWNNTDTKQWLEKNWFATQKLRKFSSGSGTQFGSNASDKTRNKLQTGLKWASELNLPSQTESRPSQAHWVDTVWFCLAESNRVWFGSVST